MNADWDEIKRLAADFQKAQLSSTLARFVYLLKSCFVTSCQLSFHLILVYQKEIALKS